MSVLDPETILNQVRHNVVCNLALSAETNSTDKRLLLDLLSHEDMAISDDVFRKALNVSGGSVGFVKVTRPVIDHFNPRPHLTGYRPNDLKVYIKVWLRFISVGFLLKFLPRILKFETETRAFVVSNPQPPTSESLQ